MGCGGSTTKSHGGVIVPKGHSPWEEIPLEVLLKFFQWMPVRDFLKWGMLSKKCKENLDFPLLWKKLCWASFPQTKKIGTKWFVSEWRRLFLQNMLNYAGRYVHFVDPISYELVLSHDSNPTTGYFTFAFIQKNPTSPDRVKKRTFYGSFEAVKGSYIRTSSKQIPRELNLTAFSLIEEDSEKGGTTKKLTNRVVPLLVTLEVSKDPWNLTEAIVAKWKFTKKAPVWAKPSQGPLYKTLIKDLQRSFEEVSQELVISETFSTIIPETAVVNYRAQEISNLKKQIRENSSKLLHFWPSSLDYLFLPEYRGKLRGFFYYFKEYIALSDPHETDLSENVVLKIHKRWFEVATPLELVDAFMTEWGSWRVETWNSIVDTLTWAQKEKVEDDEEE